MGTHHYNFLFIVVLKKNSSGNSGQNKLLYYDQRQIQDSVKHQSWSFCAKKSTAKSCYLFLQKAPSQMIDWILNVPLMMNVATIIEIILWNFLNLYQVFLSPQVKRSPIISNKQSLYEFTHELPNNLRLRILGNYEKSGKSQKSFTRIVVRKTLFPLKTYSFL